MNQHDYAHLHVTIDTGVAHVTIDNPPVNVLGFGLMTELSSLLTSLADDASVRVIVFDSADPDFFIAHVDMTLGEDQGAVAELMARAPKDLNPFQALNEQLRKQPQVTIVKLAGLARGGGAEFVTAADLAFAAIGRAGLGQIEALMGIVPGGGGTQYLAHRIGRNRALEVVLGAGLFDAGTAERYGWVNRALPADELDDFVDQLARNIAGLSDGVVAAAKSAIRPADLSEGMVRESEAWGGLVFLPAAGELMAGGLGGGAQTPDGERDLEGLFRRLRPVSGTTD
ncbi:enoyl-CoA hydratase/isomerase family protein [Streptomyces sp. NPDC048254]|uniref:enoyl-CoA hydratase/isomerase family protein n=1 Tax=Streptomyces sp. NPDC048254 TaxID=3365525 RepID=UPI00372111F8